MSRKKLVIAIGGGAGSGKTTYARYIAEKTGLKLVSAGAIFRKLAEEKGLSLVELNRLAEREPEIDILIDRITYESAKEGGVVIEGHLVPWIVKDFSDLLIYMVAPLKVRVERISRREGRGYEEVLYETLRREFSQAVRFKKLYGLDVTDLSIFNYIIDTSRMTVQEVYNLIDSILEHWL